MSARRQSRQRGNALIVVLVVTVMILALATTMLEGVASSAGIATAGRERMAAFYVADGALRATIARLRADESLGSTAAVAATATASGLFGRGAYTTSAIVLPGTTLVAITCTGLVGGERRSVEAIVEAGFDAPIAFRYAAHAGAALLPDAASTIDSYLSTLGTPTAALLSGSILGRERGDLSADRGYVILNGATSRGALYAGPEASGAGSPSGGVVPLDDPLRARPILRPAGAPPTSGPLSIAGSSSVTIGPGTFVYDSIHLIGSARLDIVGPATVIVDGDVSCGGTSFIYLDHGPGRRIQLHARGPGAQVQACTPQAPPQTCNLWLAGGADASFTSMPDAGTAFYGTIYMYTPTEATLVQRGAVPVVGSIYAARRGRLEQQAGASILYDEALAADPVPVSSGPTYEVLRWRELP